MTQPARSALHFAFQASGVVPLAVYAVVHVGCYAAALFGASDFGVPDAQRPALLALEIALVWLPLAFHTVYGITRFASALPAATDARRLRTEQLLQRLSGAAVLVFLFAHVAWLRAPLWSGQRAPEDVAMMITAGLSATTAGVPVAAALHLVGLAAVALHLDLGLARFADELGLLRERAARGAAHVLCGAFFATAALTIVELATGSWVPNFVR